MTHERPYEVVDVFAERPFEGNPLTVVLDAAGLDTTMMQRIALETNHSETTFVTGPIQAGCAPVRIFTPRAELPFAGHPTLGTAFVTGADALELKVGRIPVDRRGELLWMTQRPAEMAADIPPRHLEDALGVRPRMARVVSTGTPVLLAELASSDEVRRAELDARRYEGPSIAGVYVFALDAEHDIHARFFADFVGIHEDPATGGAAGPLAALLHARGELDRERIIRQGLEMGRPSTLHIALKDGRPRVGGKVVRVARGALLA